MTSFAYLKEYSSFENVKQMDKHVQGHVRIYHAELKGATREVLFNIAKRALKFVGATHLKVETIAKEIGVSTKTVYRATKKLVELKIIEKINKTKLNGIKGANIYKILPCVSSNVPSEMSHRREAEETCVQKRFNSIPKDAITNSFNTVLKSLNNTFITAQSVTSSVSKSIKKEERKQQEQQALREALLAKMPAPLRVLDLFVTDNDELFECNGAIFNAKKAVDASVRIEEHADAYKQMITSVVEYYKRKVAVDGPAAHNLAGLLYVSTKALTKRIANGEYYAPKAEQQPVKEDVAVNGVTQAMIDNETDPFEKDRLLKQRKGTRVSGRVEKTPDWFATRHEQAEEELTAAQEAELEAARQRILAKLYV